MDGYGIYEQTEEGYILTGVDQSDERSEYEIIKGTVAIANDAFKGVGTLKKITIPASLKTIPEGALSNGEGWASKNKGIDEIIIDKENSHFMQEGDCFCEVLEDGNLRLLRVTGSNLRVIIPKNVTLIGKRAFLDRLVEEVYIEKTDVTIYFPTEHTYYLRRLLANFGENSEIYDFNVYDNFLLEDSFNPQRLKMACGRINQTYGITNAERDKLKNHLNKYFTDIMKTCETKADESTLTALATAGFFTESNIDDAMKMLNESDRRDLLAWMLDYKNDNFARAEADFSI